ncbi:formyltransferase family protein [Candidatus Thioglobus sp.]|nr:formyltransferase family protein [Candidatus Thioglobus sp.]
MKNSKFKIVLLVTEKSWYVLSLLEMLSSEKKNEVLLLLKKNDSRNSISSINNNIKGIGILPTLKKLLRRLPVQFKFLKYKSKIIKIKSFSEVKKIHNVDISIAYNTGILGYKAYNHPVYGTICAHPALLPKGRGIAGSDQSILNNDPVGVTIFKIGSGVDTGDIFFQQEININKLYSYSDLRESLSNLSLILTIKSINAIKNGGKPYKQEAIFPYVKLDLFERKKAMKLWKEVFDRNKRHLI